MEGNRLTFECPDCGDSVLLSPGWNDATPEHAIQCTACHRRYKVGALRANGFIYSEQVEVSEN